MNHYATPAPQTCPEDDYMSMYVEVTTWAAPDELYEDDKGALGTFEVRVPRHLSPAIAAAAALGAFHSIIPIKYLCSFDFDVYDEDDCLVKPAHGANCYDLAEEHQAYLVD